MNFNQKLKNSHEEKPEISIRGRKFSFKQAQNKGKMLPGHNTTETSPALWDAALSVSNTSAKGRGRLKKSEVVHFPEFEEAYEMVNDPFWRDILRGCARKKFPRGFMYFDNFLHHRANNIYIALLS